MAKRKDFLTMVRERKEKGEIPDYESRLKEAVTKLEDRTTEEPEDLPEEEKDARQNVLEIKGTPSSQASPKPDGTISDQTTGRPSELPSGLPNDLPGDLPGDQPSGRPSGRPSELPSGLPSGPPDLKSRLHLNERAFLLLLYIYNYSPLEISELNLSSVLGVPISSLKRATKRLKNRQFISVTTHWDGPNTYKRYVIDPEVHAQLKDESQNEAEPGLPSGRPSGLPSGRTTGRTTGSKIDRFYLSSSLRGGSEEGGGQDQVSQSGADCDDKLLDMSDSDIEFHWPRLASYGFGGHQIRQIVGELKKIEKTREYVLRGLDHIEFEIEHDQLVDKNGEKVGKVCDWAYRSLAKNGYYRRPEGYVSPEEQADRDATEEAKQRKQAKYKRAVAEFEVWRAEMTDEEKQELLKGKRGPEQQWLWAQFKKIFGYEGKI